MLRHAHEITAITNQTVNSYKRLVPGFEAPAYVSWAQQPVGAGAGAGRQEQGQSTRIEYRAPDPACNPYLAFAVILAAGLKGIEEGYELPPEAATNIFELTDEERAAERLEPLPQSLDGALTAMEQSELVAEALGEHIFEWFLRNKRREWPATSPRSRRSRSTATSARCRRYPPRHEVPDRRFSAVGVLRRKGVEIDFCPQCRGVWLDRGELDKIIDRAANTLAGSTPACRHRSPGAGASTAATPTGARSPDDGRNRKRRKRSFLDDLFDD